MDLQSLERLLVYEPLCEIRKKYISVLVFKHGYCEMISAGLYHKMAKNEWHVSASQPEMKHDPDCFTAVFPRFGSLFALIRPITICFLHIIHVNLDFDNVS